MLPALLCLALTSSSQMHSTIAAYSTFIKSHDQSAKDYILSLFEKHDIVIICERTHPEMTQYDLFTDIIADDRFIDNVGNIFVEIGVSKLNPSLNNFLHSSNLTADSISASITKFQRNASMWPIWSPANYELFYKKLYELNNPLPMEKKVNVYPSDIPFSWPEADSVNIVALKQMLPARDSIIASQVIAGFNDILNAGGKRKKALVIMNYRHAFNQEFSLPGGRLMHNVAYYLFKQYGDRVANVFLNTIKYGNTDSLFLLQQGRWDAAFKSLNKKSAGFDFNGSPFGKDSFDIWPLKNSFTYSDVFTGFVFYQPVENHILSDGRPGLVDSIFKPELMRRVQLISGVGNEFKSKMAGFEKALNSNIPFLNLDEKKKYYQLDNLLTQRNQWLKMVR